MTEYIYEHKPSGADHMGKPVELPMLVQREEIVRCRDCRYYREEWIRKLMRSVIYCDWLDGVHIEPDGFCAWGERREQ